MSPSYDPVPWFLRDIPAQLRTVDPPAEAAELRRANEVRAKFELEDGPGAYMVDIVRAFRLARDAKVYIEVGSRDKGNIAWASSILAEGAKIIDVDLKHVKEAKKRLKRHLPAGVDYTMIEGDSVGQRTIRQVDQALRGKQADVIFLDSSHMYTHFAREVALYWQFLRPGGWLLVHDIFWEGNDAHKGKAQAADRIDRHHPVYVVSANDPVTRFYYRSAKTATWGGVGIMLKPE